MKSVWRAPIPSGVRALAGGSGHAAGRVARGISLRPVVVVCAGAGSLLVPPAADAWTLGRLVLVRIRAWDPARVSSQLLLAHELVHVAQWREDGPVLFLARYLAAYAKGRMRGLSHDTAYRAIPAEIEAFEIQRALTPVTEPC